MTFFARDVATRAPDVRTQLHKLGGEDIVVLHIDPGISDISEPTLFIRSVIIVE